MSTLTNVNNSDIRSAIELGCRTMASVFNADDNEIPFFGSEVLPNPRLGFSSVHSESHVPGRHLNALLAAEEIAGVSIDEEAVRKHTAPPSFPIPELRLYRSIATSWAALSLISMNTICERDFTLCMRWYATGAPSVQRRSPKLASLLCSICGTHRAVGTGKS